IAAGVTMDASDRDVVRVRLGRSKAPGKGGGLRQAGGKVEKNRGGTHPVVGGFKEGGGGSHGGKRGKRFSPPGAGGGAAGPGAGVLAKKSSLKWCGFRRTSMRARR